MSDSSHPASPPRLPWWLPAGLLGLLLLAGGLLLIRPTPAPAGPGPTVTPTTAAPATVPAAEGAGTPATVVAPPAEPSAPATAPAATTGTPAALPGVAAPATGPAASTPAAGGAFGPAATLAVLAAARIPGRDLYTLTAQIKVKTTTALPHTTGAPPPVYRLGDTAAFAVGDAANGAYYTVTATLRDITPHAYWWVAAGNDVDLDALRQSADRFERKIYPGDRATFGEPPSPGVDGDPHINVLNAPLSGALGYFSAADMYTRAVNPYSNQRKMIYAGVAPGGGAYDGLLAHEFQHMIHWNVHPNQNVWINEGMAELAMTINGADTGGTEVVFEQAPDVQLNDWSSPPDTAIPHYGAAFLFMTYLYQQYGASMIAAILHAPGGDTDAVDAAFAALGRPERFPQVFMHWALANWLGTTAADPRDRYPHLYVQVRPRATLAALPATYRGTVHQQAADYLILPRGATTVAFTGALTVPLIPAAPHSGQALWWSNRADISAPSLTRAFDLRGVPRATLSYWTWYDIEDGYDYAYAEVSTDGGQTWYTLAGTGTTAANPNGNNLGHGYTAHSGGGATSAWVQEQADLAPYAGKPILIRFQYVTDDGTNYGGFAVDDIRIPEIGFADDAEAPGANGWTAAGFVHVAPVLPEQFVVALITTGASGPPAVTLLPLDAANTGRLSIPPGTQRAVLLVAPLAPATEQVGHYRVTVR